MKITYIEEYEIDEKLIKEIMQNGKDDLGEYDFFSTNENDIVELMKDILIECYENVENNCIHFKNDIQLDNNCEEFIKEHFKKMFDVWINETDTNEKEINKEEIDKIYKEMFEIKIKIDKTIEKLEIFK